MLFQKLIPGKSLGSREGEFLIFSCYLFDKSGIAFSRALILVNC